MLRGIDIQEPLMRPYGKFHIPCIPRKEPSGYYKSHIPPSSPDASAGTSASAAHSTNCSERGREGTVCRILDHLSLGIPACHLDRRACPLVQAVWMTAQGLQLSEHDLIVKAL